MAGLSQSHFLQSLGWATLNSLWQMALLWCLYLAVNSIFKLSANHKYRFSVVAIFSGFIWFLFSFIYYYEANASSGPAFINNGIGQSSGFLQILLTSASVAYLAVLIIPSYRLFKNWQFVKKIKTKGLHKAGLEYRLFVLKVAVQIGIAKKVVVYISDIVRSPVTVGYLKPVILIPVAALNNLSPQQMEAVLLHELSHIKRYDYIINLLVSCIHTLLYFNPFIKLFMKNMEAERENCCDELVLQFGYDKVGYASALLTLEKTSSQPKILTLAATGKKYLLSRIEKITGMEKKKEKMKFSHLAGFLGALFCILIFNSILILKEQKKNQPFIAYENANNPFNFFGEENENKLLQSPPTLPAKMRNNTVAGAKNTNLYIDIIRIEENEEHESGIEEIREEPFVQVVLDEADASLTEDQKKHVKSTVAATKKMLRSQWPVVEESIADAMNKEEKLMAKKDYLREVENVDWKNLEQNLKSGFDKVDWNNVNTTISNALTTIQLDSLQKNYNLVLTELNRTKRDIENLAKANVYASPLPDCSVEEIKKAKADVVNQINIIKGLKAKKIVRL